MHLGHVRSISETQEIQLHIHWKPHFWFHQHHPVPDFRTDCMGMLKKINEVKNWKIFHKILTKDLQFVLMRKNVMQSFETFIVSLCKATLTCNIHNQNSTSFKFRKIDLNILDLENPWFWKIFFQTSRPSMSIAERLKKSSLNVNVTQMSRRKIWPLSHSTKLFIVHWHWTNRTPICFLNWVQSTVHKWELVAVC